MPRIAFDQLEIEIDGLDCGALLADWRWLVPDDLRPVSLTIFGDWFFEDGGGRIVFLDTVAGTLSEVAESHAAFLVERMKPENLAEWYLADLARLCRKSGLRPAAGQCLSWKVPPVLSGPVELENVEVCDLLVHESLLGQIHRGAQDLPEGTPIRRFVEDDES